MMKKLLIFLIILPTVIFSINSFAYQNEPDGFRGIKWGTKIETLKDMTKQLQQGDEIQYTRISDKLQIGNAEVDDIVYVFWKDKFISVMIMTKGFSNWSALKEEAFKQFCKGSQDNKNIETYTWGSVLRGKTFISLKYNQISEQTRIVMFPVNMLSMIKKNRKKKPNSIKSFTFLNEPDGFRGIKWGTKIDTLNDMTKRDKEQTFAIYERNNDKLQIGNVDLKVLYYMFWQGKFNNMFAEIEGYSNWISLKQIYLSKYGKGKQKKRSIEKYRWGNFSGKTVILLEYNGVSNVGTLMIFGAKIMKEGIQFEKQKSFRE
jgi:hypothetical protein